MDEYENQHHLYEPVCPARSPSTAHANQRAAAPSVLLETENSPQGTKQGRRIKCIVLAIVLLLMTLAIAACFWFLIKEDKGFIGIEEGRNRTADKFSLDDLQHQLNDEIEIARKEFSQKIEKIQSAVKEVEAKIVEIEGTAQRKNTVLDDVDGSVVPVCRKNKCLIPFTDIEVTVEKASEQCVNKGGQLADIKNKEEFYALMKYIRAKRMEGKSVVDFHLGMTANPSTQHAYLSNGTLAPYEKWDETYPYNDPEYTALLLQVNRDPASADQYFWNCEPNYQVHYVCEV